MCLTLHWSRAKQTDRLRNKKKPIKAYKILRHGRKSPIWVHFWKMGWNKSSRESAILTDTEQIWGAVTNGFHFYTTKRHALYDASCSRNEDVWEVEIRPEDIVAAGRYYSDPAIVATRAKLVRKVKTK